MITSIFEKTRPINYLIIGILLLLFFLVYFFSNGLFQNQWFSVGYFLLYLGLTGTSILLLNFIVLKNNLAKGNNFSELLFLCFLLFFPEILKNGSVLIANFFSLLAFRRLLSLNSMKNIKEKLFDASFWIFVAALFHFWVILYILLVFISIALDSSRDYKNWLIPFIAFFGVGILFAMINLWFDNAILEHLLGESYISFNFSYFDSVYQNIAFASYVAIALLFLVNMFLTLGTKPLNLQSSFKKVIASFVLTIIIFVVSADKNNSLLLFSIAPLSIMGANYLQDVQMKSIREAMVVLLLGLGLFFFITAL